MTRSKLKSHLRQSTIILGIVFCAVSIIPAKFAAAATDQWSTSLHDVSRSGASTDTNLTTAKAPGLTKLWSLNTGAPIASQAAIVNGVAYIGSWDGNEYALDAATGAVKWKTPLGITTGLAVCNPQKAGVSSAATVVNNTVYVGGGDSNWYALNATTGAVLWSVPTGDNSAAGGHYNWSSPLIVGNFAYIGISSLGDCPLVQGELLKVDLTTHQVVNTLKLVPDGQVGGGIWTSPSYDPATDTIYATTGTEQSDAQQYAQAVVTINATSMAVTGVWHLPETQAVADSDWTTSAMLFTDSGGRKLVMATNKNGNSYAFLRSNIAAGPVWQQQIAIGNECAACGFSTVSSAAFGQGLIYQAGGVTTINGKGYGGSVQAWDPATGNVVWQHPLSGPVIGALTYDNGMVIEGGSSAFEVLDASNGHRLYSSDTGAGNWFYAASAVSNGTVVTGNIGGTIFGFGMPATTPPPPPPDTHCPTGWLCQDIGSPTPAGSENVTTGTWNITAGGTGVAGTGDSFRLMSQTTAGNSQIVAKVTAQQGISANSQAGIMMRQSNDPGSPFYAAFATPQGVRVVYRNSFGGNITTVNSSNPGNLPIYLEIQRNDDTLQAATSTDGITYTLVPGATATVIMPYTSLIGLAASSDTGGVSGTSTISNVTVSAPNNTPQNTPPATACPTGWTCGDVGDPQTVGDQSLTGGAWTVKGSGNGIDGSTDQMHYVWQSVPGDATATAHITGQTNTAAAAKAGIMMRADASSGAAYYGAFMTPDGKINVQYRRTNSLPRNTLVSASGALPQYLRVVRTGTTFTTYTSSDGNTWAPVVGSTLTLSSLSGSILAGLAATSANTAATSTLTADNVTITAGGTTPPTACPTNWSCNDVGSPIPAGSQYYYNGVWSVLAGGKDIWDTNDEMRFVGQNLNGDGSVSARVSAQGDTDPWAKAGLVIRGSSTDSGAPYFGIFTTPETNGTVIQYRPSQGAATTQITGVSAKAPLYLKISRTGNTFTAYTSTDGVTWTAFPGGNISIPAIPTNAPAGMASTSHSQFTTNTTTFDGVTFTPKNANLPSPWTDNDIDNSAPAGSASVANNVFTVAGGGNDIWGTAHGALDQSHYVSQPLSGDGSIVARVNSQTNTDPWAKSGIMIKQSATADAPYALLAVTPGNGVTFQSNFNSSTSGGAFTLPEWLKLTRTGNTITAFTSTNGTTWTQVGTTNVTLTNSATAGLVVSSHNAGALSTAAFDNVNVTTSGTTGGGLPAPWTDGDVGNATPAGSASFANNVYTVNGGGNDIWGTAGGNLDQFHYVSQSLTGNGTITARVTSQTNTSDWAKAGVMIKQSTTAGTNYALLGTTPTNGMTFQYNFTGSAGGGNYTFPNAWVRLTRTGNMITAFTSPDGNTWTQVGTANVTLNDPITVGLFDCSHNAGALSTATFDNVNVTTSGTTGALPAPWTDGDVGNATPAGTASFANNVFTVAGGGNDIWGTAGGNLDQFHYVSQALSGNTTITARVTSQTNTDPWAKAGVMVKQSTTSGTNYALLGATPANGITFQYNFTGSAGGGNYTFPNAWVRLKRVGNTITSYTSPDGNTWTQVGTATVTLNDPITVGLFDCSHNAGALSTATFDNVSVTSP